VSGTPGPLLVDWPGAEQRGFAGLATHGPGGVSALRHARTLAAAAGATTGIATTGIATTGIELLLTNMLLAPIYPPVLLGKAAASIDQLSGGRLTSGSLPGGRADDCAVFCSAWAGVRGQGVRGLARGRHTSADGVDRSGRVIGGDVL
jgi:hypothetical protein